MEILRYITDFLLKAYGKEDLAPIIKALENNNFDIKKTVSGLNPDTVIPVLKTVFSSFAQNQNQSAAENPFSRESFGTAPLSGIADNEIVYRLNRYLG